MMSSELVNQAKRFAEKAHKGQVRKLDSEPFMNHPTNVAAMLDAAGLDEIVVAAGYLHDVIEDTMVSADELETEFGRDVLQLVLGNTEDNCLSWDESRTQTIKRAREGSLQLKALIAADKFDNISSILKYYGHMGEKVWSVFSRGKYDQYWFYSEVAKALFENVEETYIPPYFYEYRQLVQQLKKIVEA